MQEAKRSVKRLRTLLCGSSAQPEALSTSGALATASEPLHPGAQGEVPTPVAEGTPGVEMAAREAGCGQSPGAGAPTPTGGHRAGTGRLRADASVGAARAQCRHEELAVGQRCPVCGQGTLDALPPGVERRIDGHGLLSAMRSALQKLRGSACGQMCTAPLPREAGEEKYRPRARAVLVVGRDYLGLPLYRIEGYQAMLGVPMPDATQGDQIERVGDCCERVFAHLAFLAAQGELIHQDDTSVRIVTLRKENQQIRAQAAAQGFSRAKERTGMCPTALVIRVGERMICLYDCGRSHAGENLAAL